MNRAQAIEALGMCLLLASAVGCGDDGEASDDGTADVGAAQFFVEAEESIPGGLEPGDGEENIADGWRVTYDVFLVTIGNLRAARSDATEELRDEAAYVLDLRNAPAGGYVLAELDDVSATRWDRFGFDLANAAPGVRSLPPTAASDVELMVQNGYSVYFEGAIEKEGGQSCPPGDQDPASCVDATRITFRWGLAAGTSFDDCATEDGLAGFAVPSGGTVQVKPTIHGDHWFFSNITAGAEITKRYAQYIADADLDLDGETTLDELRAIPAADLFPSPKYNLSGGLEGAIDTAYDYVLAQARTLGDFQGDGECPTRRVLP